MTLSLIQAGHGASRLLVVCYFVSNHDALAAFGPDACVLVDNDNARGRFAGAPGGSGVASWADTLRTAHTLAGAFTPSASVLVGWSAGAQACREQIRSGMAPDVVLALDGTSGDVPPKWAQLAPWHAMAERARRGEALLVLTATQNLYTRDLPPGERYEATAYVVTELWSQSRPLTSAELLPPVEPGNEYREGDFVVAVHRSGRIDGEAHRREQNVHLPDLVRRVVLPWLAARRAAAPTDPPPTWPTGAGEPRDARALQAALNRAGASPLLKVDGIIGPLTRAALRAFQGAHGLPVTGEPEEATWAALAPFPAPQPLSVGLAALERLRAEVGVHETPGPGVTPRVVEYGSGAVRDGKRLDLGQTDEPPWCAALQGWAERDLPGALPWRWACSEVWADAVLRGLARNRDYRPQPGDLAVFARGGGDPRRGGPGHVARVERAVDAAGNYATIGGNEGGAAHHGGEVMRTERNMSDPTLVGWIVRT
jgi:peptidoglycan hydrolase-like protein with peptidoglycan-binding domain